MIAVVQRVHSAKVDVDGETVGKIEQGLLALVAIEPTDTQKEIDWMALKLTQLRIFPNAEKSFDLDVRQINGGILLVSNFTVAADARKGRRPSLDGAAPPELGKILFDQLVQAVRAQNIPTETGKFGAHMDITLVNDGPITLILRTE